MALVAAPQHFGVPVVMTAAALLALAMLHRSRSDAFARATDLVFTAVALIAVASRRDLEHALVMRGWDCGFDPTPMLCRYARFAFLLTTFVLLVAAAASATRAVVSRLPTAVAICLTAIAAMASIGLVVTGLRRHTLPDCEAYVDRMPIVASRVIDTAGPLDDDRVEADGAQLRLQPLELTIDGVTIPLRWTRGCEVLPVRVVRVRHDKPARLWVIEDARGHRCAVDERAGAHVTLMHERVGGSVGTPTGWLFAAAVTILFGLGVIASCRRARAPAAAQLGPYRTPDENAIVVDPSRPLQLRLALATALFAMSAAPMVWLN